MATSKVYCRSQCAPFVSKFIWSHVPRLYEPRSKTRLDTSPRLIQYESSCVSSLLQVKTLDAEEYNVTGLREKQQYQFRVAAENEVGVGDYAELPNVVPKSQHGTWCGLDSTASSETVPLCCGS